MYMQVEVSGVVKWGEWMSVNQNLSSV